MMSISARSAGGAVSYYVHMREDARRPGEHDRPEEYYAKEGSGVWYGTGARALGLSDDVVADDFAALCAGFDSDGRPLV